MHAAACLAYGATEKGSAMEEGYSKRQYQQNSAASVINLLRRWLMSQLP